MNIQSVILLALILLILLFVAYKTFISRKDNVCSSCPTNECPIKILVKSKKMRTVNIEDRQNIPLKVKK